MIRNLILSTLLVIIWSCGRNTGSSSGGGSVVGDTVSGVFKSASGSQSEMASWVVVFLERDTGVVNAGVLGKLGNYTISNIRPSQPQTIVLLDPQYRLSAVLSSPAASPSLIHQYFTASNLNLPALVHQGPVIKFSDLTGVSWTPDLAVDSDEDTIPDGIEDRFGLTQSDADTDGDGVINRLDPDLDGDGVANWFDSDDDGDGVMDPFDTDSNDDGILDISQTVGDLHFTTDVAFLSVQTIQDVQADSSLKSQLLLTLKLKDAALPSEITIRGADGLFSEASVTNIDLDDGSESVSAWDFRLLDDGLSEDGAAGDRVYARKVDLQAGVNPKTSQVILFQATDENETSVTHAYTFPAFTTGALSGSYDAATQLVTKAGSPFASEQNYLWSVSVFDATGIKVFSSESMSGTVDTLDIPAAVLEGGQTYTAKVIANSFDRINSFPTWTVRSLAFAIQ